MDATLCVMGPTGVCRERSSRARGSALGMGSLAFLSMLLAPSWSAGQAPGGAGAPASPAGTVPAGVIKPISVDVVLGRSTVVKTPYDAIQAPVVSSSTICSATLIGRGSIVVNGLVLGTAQISAASDGQPKDVVTYEVHVIRDKDYFVTLATFINQNVPNCQQITLTLSPDTRKVLVGGSVWTHEAIRQIYDLLISPDLQQSDIINQMWWACPPGTGVSYRTN
jgi:hypothetical protein